MRLPDLRFGYAPLPEPAPGFDPAGDARALLAAGMRSPATAPIPGVQLSESLGEGQRYVFRLPEAWNGALVVCGTPAMRSEFVNDAIFSDFFLARGYAFASSNKGVPYNAAFEAANATPDPGAAYRIPFDLPGVPKNSAVLRFGALQPRRVEVAAWHADLPALILAAKGHLRALCGSAPRRTYAAGVSIGGGQVRWLLERHPELVDGGLEWASVYWHPRQNILTYLPAFLREMPAYVASGFTDAAAHDAIVRAGFPPDRLGSSEAHPSLWNDHYALAPFYADLTTFAFARLLDPDAAPPDSLEKRAAYVPSAAARDTIATFAHTGAIERPLIGLVGDADVFITPEHHAAPYLAAVRAAGRAGRYWQYWVAGGTHVDAYVDFGYGLQAQLPFVWRAFDQLVAIVEKGAVPPGAGTARLVHTPDQL